MATSLDKTILRFCIHDDNLLVRCVAELRPEYFEKDDARTLFDVIAEYYHKSGCRLTYSVLDDTLEYRELKDELQHECGVLFEELEDEEADVREFEHYLGKFKRSHVERNWENIRDRFTGNPDDDYKLFKSEGIALFEGGDDDCIKRGDIVSESKKLLEEYKKIESNPEMAYGTLTGFSVIDHETLGMHPGELWLISGRPGSGKSIMLLNMAINAYRSGKKVMIFSLEMPLKQYIRRFQSCYASIPYNGMRAGQLTKEQKKAFVDAVTELDNNAKEDQHNLLIVDIPRANALTIESEIRRAVLELDYKPDVIVVDYLGIMRAIQKGNADWQEQGFAAEELRKLARELNIPFVTASQLNRDKKRTKGTERIGRSDIIGATCDVFLQIEEKDEEQEKLSTLLDDSLWVYIGKCRDGRADQSFQLWKNFEKMQLKDKATFKTPQERVLEKFDNIEKGIKDEVELTPTPEEDKIAKQNGDYIDV